MTTPVNRPFSPPIQAQTTPAQPKREAADVRAAQRAFFRQAVGDSTPVRAPAAMDVRAPDAANTTRQIIRPTPAEKPDRVMRPGSFIDIKI